MITTPDTELRKRDSYIDNLKIILIFLVVVTHYAGMYIDVPSMQSIYNAFCSFLMPEFIFITGYLSKKIVSQRKSDIINVLVPYLLLQAYHLIFTKMTGLGNGSFNITIPTFQNWYLLALFIWRLLVPYFHFFNKTAAIIAVFAISLLIGFIPQFDKFLALHRAIFYLPFFVLGYFCIDIKNIIARFHRFKPLFILLFFCSIAAIILLSYFSKKISYLITYAYLPAFGYHSLKYYTAKSLLPFVIRFFGMAISIFISWFNLFLVPMKKTWYSKFGRNTIYVFLFHMFLVWPIATIPYKPVITELSVLIFSFLISYLLSQDFVVKILRPFINPGYFFNKLSGRHPDLSAQL